MISINEDSSAFRFSTSDLLPATRVESYCDIFRSSLAKFEIQPLDDLFCCEARYRNLGHAKVFHSAGSSIRVNWRRRIVEDNMICLAVFGEGAWRMSQRGRELEGDRERAVVVSPGDPMEMFRTGYTYICLPKATIGPLVRNLDATMTTAMSAAIEPMRLLVGYAHLLIRNVDTTLTPEVRQAAATHLHDLASLALGPRPDAAEIAARRGLRVARLKAIEADILRNLTGRVSADDLAVRHGVSPRYIYKLFECEGTTLSRFVANQRFARVHRLLTDPSASNRAISTLAFEAGFGDLSTFNREFRRRYADTPSGVRERAKRETDDL